MIHFYFDDPVKRVDEGVGVVRFEGADDVTVGGEGGDLWRRET